MIPGNRNADRIAGLNAALAAGFGPGRVLADSVLQNTPRALVASARDAQGRGAEVIVKWFKGARGPSMVDCLRAEHDRIGPALAHPPFMLARYRDLAPAQGLAVLTRAPGRRLDHALRESPHARLKALELAGGWLAAYCAPGRQAGAVNLHARIRKRKETAGLLPPEDAALVGRTMPALRAIARDLAAMPLALAATHGDFAPHNLHLDVDGAPVLWGFDVQQTRVLPVATDTGRFLTLIALRLGCPPGPHRHGLPRADLEAFLGGAGMAETPDLAFFVADHLLRSILERRQNAAHLSAARTLLLRWLEEQE